ncbi:alpha/beta fold hydrolase [Dongia sp.]|uniref:alpha/beta fold hydrolase n=1 Tax=Dongia sp. TaxID=1977262 RepID=UPI0035B478D4
MPQIQKADPAALMAALQAEGRRRFGQLLTGIEAYRRHPARRDLADMPVLWDQGTTKLRDYRTPKSGPVDPRRPRLLVIPSLVNRYYVLDLEKDGSFLRWLGANGFDPFVVDWDGPGYVERSFSLTDYIAGRLEQALDAVKREPGGPIFILGYCMGGDLALALALRRQADIAGLVCLATPWDFHAENAAHAQMMGQVGRQLEPVLQILEELPVDMLQAFFSGLDPFQVLKKFQYFGTLDPASPSARRFVALEDWLNDGISLAAPVARECLSSWYGENTPGNLQWRIDGKVVDPAGLDRPVLNVIPSADRIVPPGSARGLSKRLRVVDEIVPNAGHIGMMVGRAAMPAVWQPLAAWIEGIVAK